MKKSFSVTLHYEWNLRFPMNEKSSLFKHFLSTVLEVIKYNQSKEEIDKTTLETLFFCDIMS